MKNLYKQAEKFVNISACFIINGKVMILKDKFKISLYIFLLFIVFYSNIFAENLPVVTDIRYSKSSEKVRIVFDLSDKADCHFSSSSFPSPTINAVIIGANISPSVKSKLKDSSDNLFIG